MHQRRLRNTLIRDCDQVMFVIACPEDHVTVPKVSMARGASPCSSWEAIGQAAYAPLVVVTSIRWVFVRHSSSESHMCKLPFLKSAWRNASLLARAGKPKGQTAYAPLVLVTRFRRPASKMRPPALRMTFRMCFCSQHQRLGLSLQVIQSGY